MLLSSQRRSAGLGRGPDEKRARRLIEEWRHHRRCTSQWNSERDSRGRKPERAGMRQAIRAMLELHDMLRSMRIGGRVVLADLYELGAVDRADFHLRERGMLRQSHGMRNRRRKHCHQDRDRRYPGSQTLRELVHSHGRILSALERPLNVNGLEVS